MPLVINRRAPANSGPDPLAGGAVSRLPNFSESGPGDFISIGLINNMPDAALEATERQFCNLLSAAAGPIELQLTYYSLPEIERAPTARERISSSYFGVEELWNSRLDAVIVTGAEPREPKLSQEPYWSRLVELMDWADKNTTSSMWSCLAAHAAVLQMDGIARHPLPDK